MQEWSDHLFYGGSPFSAIKKLDVIFFVFNKLRTKRFIIVKEKSFLITLSFKGREGVVVNFVSIIRVTIKKNTQRKNKFLIVYKLRSSVIIT